MGSSELVSLSPSTSSPKKGLNFIRKEETLTEASADLASSSTANVTTDATEQLSNLPEQFTHANEQTDTIQSTPSQSQSSVDQLQGEIETIISQSMAGVGESTSTATASVTGDEQSNNLQMDLGSYLDGKLDDLSAFTSSNIYTRRTLSGELSTVSEVSEEMSTKTRTDVSISSTAPSSPALSGQGAVRAAPAAHGTSKLATATGGLDDRPHSSSSSDSSSKGSSSSSCGCNILDDEEGDIEDEPDAGEKEGEDEDMAKGGTLKRKKVTQGVGDDEDSSSGSFMLEKPSGQLPQVPQESAKIAVAGTLMAESTMHELTSILSKEDTDDSSFRYQDISKHSDDTSRSAVTGDGRSKTKSKEDASTDKLHRHRWSEHKLEPLASEEATSQESTSTQDKLSKEKDVRDEDDVADEGEEEEVEEIEHELLMEDEVGAGGVTGFDVESSQATERDFAKSEFSLEQQSSQELDEESFSTGAALAASASLVSGSSRSSDRFNGQPHANIGPGAINYAPSAAGASGHLPSAGRGALRQASSDSTKPDVTTSGSVTNNNTKSSSSRPPVPAKSALVLESKTRTLDQRRKDFLNEKSKSHDLTSVSTAITSLPSAGQGSSISLPPVCKGPPHQETTFTSAGQVTATSSVSAVQAIVTTGGTLRDLKQQLQTLSGDASTAIRLGTTATAASSSSPQPPPVPPHRTQQQPHQQPHQQTLYTPPPSSGGNIHNLPPQVSPGTVTGDTFQGKVPPGPDVTSSPSALYGRTLHYPLPPRPAPSTSTCMVAVELDTNDPDEDIGYYDHYYRSHIWLYINKKAELDVWLQRLAPSSGGCGSTCPPEGESGASSSPLPCLSPPPRPGSALATERPEDAEKTDSEKCFVKQFESLTHRMIHRKATTVMYSKILNSKFHIEKSLLVNRSNGEFGFRIHGSRPVVVSAIERATPAESSGLEVGDIIVAINDVNVLDSAHSDVVKLAHSGIVNGYWFTYSRGNSD